MASPVDLWIVVDHSMVTTAKHVIESAPGPLKTSANASGSNRTYLYVGTRVKIQVHLSISKFVSVPPRPPVVLTLSAAQPLIHLTAVLETVSILVTYVPAGDLIY